MELVIMKKTETITPETPDASTGTILYPSKEEIIQILREENPPIDRENKFNQLFLIVEFKKINSRIGIIKGELYINDILDYRGSFLVPLINDSINTQNQWNSMEIGASIYYGLSFDSRELCLAEKIGEFFHRSFEEGRIQDFIPFIGMKSS
jgi:hypothetical protein